MQLFNTLTLASLFISNMLSEVPLPIFSTVRDKDYILLNNYYIYGHKLIKCTKSGYLIDEEQVGLLPSDTLFPNNNLFPLISKTKAEYDFIAHFDFGRFYPKLTYMYLPDSKYYSSETHYQLGRFLRALRDIRYTNYMPMYNCFNAKNISNIILSRSGVEEETNKKKVYSIPVKYNTEYTIRGICDTAVNMQAIKYSYKLISDKFTSEDKCIYKDFGKLDKDKLTYFTLATDKQEDLKYEKQLYLCFQAVDNITDLAILEGHYTKPEKKIIAKPDYNLIYNPSLLNTVSDTNYAFSDRLIEGLLNGIINPNEEFYYNIGKAQEALGIHKNNIWTDTIQAKAFTEMLENNKIFDNIEDVTGYIDKDMKTILGINT